MTTTTDDQSELGATAHSEPLRKSARGVRGYVLTAVAALAIGAVAGAIWRGYQAPFVLDDPFWREFWSGPPAAGIFALAGAVVAFLAALIAAATARRAALRNEWWDRTEWALDRLVSDERASIDIGMSALEVLTEQATKTEALMVSAITTSRFLRGSPGTDVDSAPLPDGQ